MYVLRERHVCSTGKETEVRPSPHPPRTLSQTRVEADEGVMETHGKVEENKAGLPMHMLGDRRQEGPHPVRDFINKVMFKMGLESTGRVLKTLSDSSWQKNHSFQDNLNIFLGTLSQKEGKKG